MVLDRKPMLLKNIPKNTVTGSHKGMRYFICKEEEDIVGYTYPEPFSFTQTADAYKHRHSCAWGEDGYQEILDWINEEYETHKDTWTDASLVSYLDAKTHI